MVSSSRVSAGRSNRIPVPTKKNGENQPKNTASILARIGLPGFATRDETDEHPRGERAENALEAELLGQDEESRDEQQRHAHRQLRARVHRALEERQQSRRVLGHADGRRDDHDAEKEQQKSRLLPGAVPMREQERHHDDRADLAERCPRRETGCRSACRAARCRETRAAARRGWWWRARASP